MAASAGHRHAERKVLNFSTDEKGSCTLTVMVNGIRFHIIAEAKNLKGEAESDRTVALEYEELMCAVRKPQELEDEQGEYQHRTSRESEKDGQDSGYSDSADSTEKDLPNDSDSGVDTSESKSKTESYLSTSETRNPETSLQSWMLKPCGLHFDELAPRSANSEKPSLAAWFNVPTHFLELYQVEGKLQAFEIKSKPHLKKRMDDLIPRMPLPKYLRENKRWYKAEDITVIGESNDPEPWHPSKVEVEGSVYFLKLVDATQPQPTKRELNILSHIEELGLSKQIRVPKIEGLVGFGNSHVEIMGFLQTEIVDPTPLTLLLDEDIPQDKRDRWAKEANRMKELLHENNIIWGDAKADNFMVDKNDRLWIIDFGGSYTEGWVDPEVMETEEGDDMGLEKITSALRDPVANTCDPGSDQAEAEAPSQRSQGKRKAEEEEDTDSEVGEKHCKRRRAEKSVHFAPSTEVAG